MPLNMESRLAYQDCYELFDKARETEKGIRVKIAEGEAWHFRMRLHVARSIDRKDNRVEFPAAHPMHGRSVYDELTVRIKTEDGSTWLYIVKHNVETMEVEPL